MSVINQMLKDLEQRNRTIQPTPLPALGLSATSFYKKKRIRHHILVLLSFIIMLGLFISLLTYPLWYTKKSEVKSNVQLKPHPKIFSHFIENNPLPYINSKPTTLTGIAMQTQNKLTSLRFLLDQPVLYRINHDITHQQLILTFDRTQPLADIPPLNYGESALKDITMENDHGDLKMTLMLNPNSEIKHLALNENIKSPELEIDIYSEALPESQENFLSSQANIKQPVMEFNAEQQYAKAMDFSNIGNANKAIQLLSNTLISFPEFLPARESLAALLLQQGDTKKAKEIIDQGLAEKPNYPILVELKARILLNEGKPNEALRMLEVAAPPLNQNLNYHAFIAALYQRQGNAGLAAKLYEQLLTQEPNKATWWLGLGIAFESLGKKNQAFEAYGHAQEGRDLTPELKAYIETRLHHL